MAKIVLQATSRQIIGKQVRALRRAGKLPAVIYGTKVEPMSISLDFKETSYVLPGVSSSQLVTVNVDGKPHETLVRERQRHPVSGDLVHIDFQEVSMTEKLRVTVRILFRGEAPAVKNYSGVVVFSQEDLEVECLPGDLPENIEVDLSGLTEIGDSLRVRDLVLSSKVEVLNDEDETIVVVTPPLAEKEEGAEGAAEPEVIEKGKKEEADF